MFQVVLCALYILAAVERLTARAGAKRRSAPSGFCLQRLPTLVSLSLSFLAERF